MVNPERIRHRIERFEIDRDNCDEDASFVSIIVDGQEKWYLGFVHDNRSFYLHYPMGADYSFNHIYSTGRLRDYLVSILPPEIYAECVARAITGGRVE